MNSEKKLNLAALFVGISWGLSTPILAGPPDPTALAVQIDRRIAEGWIAANEQPAPPADDATFHRRVTLDLIGRIPTVAESQAFLADPLSDKRARLVSRLVSSAARTRHAARFWRQQWVPQTDSPQFAILAEELDDWLAARLRSGATYDVLVRDLMTASHPGAAPRQTTGGNAASSVFLAASEYRPENLAANTARAFLGINLDCAQCHDHPFARWTRNQFWETAAFFARIPVDDVHPVKLMLEIPHTKATAQPRVLADPQPSWPDRLHEDTGRTILANWVTSPENPWFARNAINRLWSSLLGSGFVEPLDDLSGDNTPSHPELLAELAEAFRDSGYDLNYLTTAIISSRTYQLSSTNHFQAAPAESRLFSHFVVRPLSGEQLYDSLRTASGLPPERGDVDLQSRREQLQFAERFRSAAGSQRSILQALSLMNGELTARLTRPESSPTLQAITDAPFIDEDEKVVTLFLAALCRRPTEAERLNLTAIVTTVGNRGSQTKLADIFWALLNCSEFSTNH